MTDPDAVPPSPAVPVNRPYRNSKGLHTRYRVYQADGSSPPPRGPGPGTFLILGDGTGPVPWETAVRAAQEARGRLGGFVYVQHDGTFLSDSWTTVATLGPPGWKSPRDEARAEYDAAQAERRRVELAEKLAARTKKRAPGSKKRAVDSIVAQAGAGRWVPPDHAAAPGLGPEGDDPGGGSDGAEL